MAALSQRFVAAIEETGHDANGLPAVSHLIIDVRGYVPKVVARSPSREAIRQLVELANGPCGEARRRSDQVPAQVRNADGAK